MSGSQENGLMLRTVPSCQLGLKKAFFSGICIKTIHASEVYSQFVRPFPQKIISVKSWVLRVRLPISSKKKPSLGCLVSTQKVKDFTIFCQLPDHIPPASPGSLPQSHLLHHLVNTTRQKLHHAAQTFAKQAVGPRGVVMVMDHDGYGNTLDVLPPRMPPRLKNMFGIGVSQKNLHVPLVSSEGATPK